MLKPLELMIFALFAPLVAAHAAVQGYDGSWDSGAPDYSTDQGGEVPFRARTQSECTTVDIRDDLSPTMKRFFSFPRIEGDFAHNPKKDDSIGFCYATGSADLLSFQTGRPVSALYLFLNYTHNLNFFDLSWRWVESFFEHDASPIPDGGVAYKAVEQSLDPQSYGMCEEGALPSSHRGDFDVDLPAAFRRLQNAIDLAQSNSPRFSSVMRSSRLDNVFVGLGSNDNEVESRLERLVYDSSRKGNGAVAILTQAARESCKGHLIRPNASPDDVVNVGHQETDILTPIDQQLDLSRPNMAIILYDTGFTRTLKKPGMMHHWFGSHVSPVIGRKWDKSIGRCVYHIRDSLFGYSCSNYNLNNVGCPGDGTFWVTDHMLWDMTSYVTYIRQHSSRR